MGPILIKSNTESTLNTFYTLKEVIDETTKVLDSNVYFVRKEMFISAESASDRIQLQLASPAITTLAAAQPQPKRRFAYRDEGVGLQLRGHTCGPDAVRSELGFDVKWNALPSKSS